MAPKGGEVTPNHPKGGLWGPLIVPGVPDCAVAMAWRSVGTICRTVRTETHALHSVLKRDSWSMSCSAPRPCGNTPR